MKSVLWASLMLLSVGCAERYRIRPTQIGELNDDLSTNNETRLKVKLETETGQIVEVSPPVVVYVTTSDGSEHTFCSPLRASFDNGNVTIKHNCGRPETIDGSEISKVEVEEY